MNKFQNEDTFIQVDKTPFPIKDPIYIYIKSGKTYVGLASVLGVFAFLFVITSHLWSRIFLVVLVVIFLYQQRDLFIHAFKRMPYVIIDANGISYKGSSYSWIVINKICFRKDITNEDHDYIIIYLDSDNKIEIPIPGTSSSYQIEELVMYFKKIKEQS